MSWARKNMRFLIVTTVLIVIVFVGWSQIGDMNTALESTQNKYKNLVARNFNALFTDAKEYNGEPATTEGRRLANEKADLDKVAEGRLDALGFETDPEYTLNAMGPNPSDDDKVSFYHRRKLELQRELGYKRYFRPDVQSRDVFGFGEPKDGVTGKDVPDLLRKFDIVRTVAHSVERTNVRRIESLLFDNAEDALAGRGVPTRATTPGEQPFLVPEALRIEVAGTEEALYNFMIDLQRPEKEGLRRRYLSIEAFEFEKTDFLKPADELIEASILIIAWRVNMDSTYPVPKKETREITTARAKTFGRAIR